MKTPHLSRSQLADFIRSSPLVTSSKLLGIQMSLFEPLQAHFKEQLDAIGKQVLLYEKSKSINPVPALEPKAIEYLVAKYRRNHIEERRSVYQFRKLVDPTESSRQNRYACCIIIKGRIPLHMVIGRNYEMVGTRTQVAQKLLDHDCHWNVPQVFGYIEREINEPKNYDKLYLRRQTSIFPVKGCAKNRYRSAIMIVNWPEHFPTPEVWFSQIDGNHYGSSPRLWLLHS